MGWGKKTVATQTIKNAGNISDETKPILQSTALGNAFFLISFCFNGMLSLYYWWDWKVKWTGVRGNVFIFSLFVFLIPLPPSLKEFGPIPPTLRYFSSYLHRFPHERILYNPINKKAISTTVALTRIKPFLMRNEWTSKSRFTPDVRRHIKTINHLMAFVSQALYLTPSYPRVTLPWLFSCWVPQDAVSKAHI